MKHHHHENSEASFDRRTWLKAGMAASLAAITSPSPLQGALGLIGPAAPPAEPYTEIAQRAERWISSSVQRRDAGSAWPWNPAEPGQIEQSLYTGTPGVVLFYLELFHATGDRTFLDVARSGADYLAASPPSVDGRVDAGLYTGLAGVAYTLAMVHRAGGTTRHRDAARRLLAAIHTAAHPAGHGMEWSESTDIISGSAGTGLFLLWAHQALGDARSLDLAVQAGRRLIERGEEDRGGLKWMVSPQIPREYPNFSHGTAGVSYFLASLHERTHAAEFLEAARAGATYLDALATTTPGGGRMVFHSRPGNEKLYYLSWCHGPVGTARLYHRLAKITGEQGDAERVGQLVQAIVDMHVPERSPGFWNNISQCCGNCGVSEFFVDLHRLNGHAQHLAFARRVADDTIVRESDAGAGLKWVQAENRVQPDVLIAQTGLMQGAAGVGLAMLHLDGATSGRTPFVALPDNPFLSAS